MISEHAYEGDANVCVPVARRKSDRASLKKVLIDLEPYNLPLPKSAADRLYRNLGDKTFTWQELSSFTGELERRIRDELATRVVYHIDTQKAQYIEPDSPLFGAEVEGSFPSASFEIDEAGKMPRLGKGYRVRFSLDARYGDFSSECSKVSGAARSSEGQRQKLGKYT